MQGAFPVDAVRAQFPALQRSSLFVFFDNGAGAQIPQAACDAVSRHLLECNVQRGGWYAQSREVDNMIARARQSVADLLNAADPREVCFGMNATSFIRLVSLGVGQSLGHRHEIILTDMDHESNIATWLALEPLGAKFTWWKIRGDGSLHPDDLRPLLSSRTRLVACTAASNAIGSIVEVRAAADMAHDAGSEIFLDCVHFAPHAPLDVQDWQCDYLVCSCYKMFAPHLGFLWGRRALLEKLPAFHEDFIPNEPPMKIEAGTFIYENVAGLEAVISYLESLGKRLDGSAAPATRRTSLVRAMTAIRNYEETLSLEMLCLLRACDADIYGIQERERVRQRVPTICFNLKGMAPARVAEELARAGIAVRDGHMYSPRLMKRLGLNPSSGAVRASLVHYNTLDEVHRFSEAISHLNKRGYEPAT